MIKIQKLKRPNKRSGYILAPLATTTIRGVVIINENSFPIHVDRWTSKKPKKKKK